MYAVIVSGGKQHRVRQGDLLRVEKINGDVGSKIALDQVLMVGGEKFKLGTPMVSGAKVTAEIVRQARAKKILVFHRIRKKNHKKLRGHRQPYTQLKITGITV
ncbi:MAG: 50S ribosomal protein L21 [Deltaproteobacteria bacterium]|nr:50S ribosomal protein L21 [Deltaproteobacteria bacterium]